MRFQRKKKRTVSSCAEAAVIEMICKDKKMNQSNYFQVFSTVRYSTSQKSLRFKSLKEFWSDGFVIKRYLEYPDVDPPGISKVFEEINRYLQRGDYVVHFVDDNLNDEEINIITNISCSNGMICFRTWQPDGKMKESSLFFKEYCNLFFPHMTVIDTMRFDIFHLVKEECIQFDETRVLKSIKEGSLSVPTIILCILHKKADHYTSFKILCRWFVVFEEFIHWIGEEGLLSGPSFITEKDRQIFKGDREKNCKALIQMLVRYNNLLRTLKVCFVRR